LIHRLRKGIQPVRAMELDPGDAVPEFITDRFVHSISSFSPVLFLEKHAPFLRWPEKTRGEMPTPRGCQSERGRQNRSANGAFPV